MAKIVSAFEIRRFRPVIMTRSLSVCGTWKWAAWNFKFWVKSANRIAGLEEGELFFQKSPEETGEENEEKRQRFSILK